MGKSNTVQQTFRFRNDDGSQTGATWMSAGNGTDQTIGTGTSNRKRLRFVIEETAGGTINTASVFYFSYNGGTYTPLTTSSSYVRSISSANTSWTITDNDTTTAQLGYSGTFTAGRYDDDGALETSIGLTSTYTELEICFYIVDADVTNGYTIDFRVYTATGVPCDAYTDTPRATVSKAAAPVTVNLNAGSASGSGGVLSVKRAETVNLSAGSATASGGVLTVEAPPLPTTVNLSAGSATASGGVLTVSAIPPAQTVNLSAGSVSVSGSALNAKTPEIINFSAGSVTVSGGVLTVDAPVTVSFSAGTVNVSGGVLTVSAPTTGVSVNLSAGSVSVSGSLLQAYNYTGEIVHITHEGGNLGEYTSYSGAVSVTVGAALVGSYGLNVDA